jgi:hypothetical protein
VSLLCTRIKIVVELADFCWFVIQIQIFYRFSVHSAKSCWLSLLAFCCSVFLEATSKILVSWWVNLFGRMVWPLVLGSRWRKDAMGHIVRLVLIWHLTSWHGHRISFHFLLILIQWLLWTHFTITRSNRIVKIRGLHLHQKVLKLCILIFEFLNVVSILNRRLLNILWLSLLSWNVFELLLRIVWITFLQRLVF